jgi:hypothetical protein
MGESASPMYSHILAVKMTLLFGRFFYAEGEESVRCSPAPDIATADLV